MAQTITSGILATDGFTIRPISSLTWADLDSSPYATWDNWTSWSQSPANIQVTETIDTGTSDYYVPLVEVLTEGTLTIEVEVSDTGLFTGEQTSYTLTTNDLGEDLTKGRYVRWNFTVEPTVDEPTPYLQYFAQANNSLVNVYLDDVSVPSLPTDSLGFRLVDHPLGAVKNVQATTLQGDDYVDNGYVFTFDALDSYIRTSADDLITASGVSYSNDVPYTRHGQSAVFNNLNDQVVVLNTDDRIVSDDFTVEFWFNTDDWTPADDDDSSVDFRSICMFDNLGEDNQGQIDIRLGKSKDSTQEIYLSYQINTVPTGSVARTHTVLIQPNTWYHFSLSIENGTLVETYLNGGDGTAPTLPNPYGVPDRIIIGNSQFADSVFIDNFEGKISEFRISNSVRYPEPLDIETVFSPFTSDLNTTLLLHFDGTVEDDNLVRTGTEDYFYRQNGGSAVVEQKNPLALKVVDYNGDAWDGAVDLALRGLPKVARLGNSLVTKFD